MAIEGWTRFEPQPDAVEVPEAYVGPAADGTAHPLAQRAVAELFAELRRPGALDGIDLDVPGGGKMFGVLVVDAGTAGIGFLRGFSGMLGRRWFVPGFVPPLFDAAALAAFWPDGEAEIDAMTDELGGLTGEARAQLVERRAARSRALWTSIQATYRVVNARGEPRSTAELFAPKSPPGGAGDCAGPKLVGAAYRAGVRPLALAETWWGATVGGRVHGSCHAPCERLCGIVLGYMLGPSDLVTAIRPGSP